MGCLLAVADILNICIESHNGATIGYVSMSSGSFPTSWTDPDYVATVVGVLALGVLVFYAALSDSGLLVDEVIFVVLVVTIPATIAREIARRWL